MNNNKAIKEIKKGNNPIILKDVVDGTTYYHTIMYVGIRDMGIETTVWAIDARLPKHLTDDRVKTLKSLTGVAFDNFRKYNTTPLIVDNVNTAYKISNGVLAHIHNTGGMDSYTTKVVYR